MGRIRPPPLLNPKNLRWLLLTYKAGSCLSSNIWNNQRRAQNRHSGRHMVGGCCRRPRVRFAGVGAKTFNDQNLRSVMTRISPVGL
jgi:hypothetical protein